MDENEFYEAVQGILDDLDNPVDIEIEGTELLTEFFERNDDVTLEVFINEMEEMFDIDINNEINDGMTIRNVWELY